MAKKQEKTPHEVLTVMDIRVGRWYRAKRPQKIWYGGFNDRYVLWLSPLRKKVQYDGPVVKTGAHFPMVDMYAFLNWASHDVTDEHEQKEEGDGKEGSNDEGGAGVVGEGAASNAEGP